MWPTVKVSLHGVASKQFSFCMFPVCRGSWGLSEKLLRDIHHLSTNETKTPKRW